MLALAERKTAAYGPRVRLVCRAYDAPLDPASHDLVVCSYSLSMFNPGYDTAVTAVHRDLAPGGVIALVDFHDTRHPWFARWMRLNHVRLAGQLRPLLHAHFKPSTDEFRRAYGGLWRYLVFVGRREA
jgi:S-adenosylmethionine-diacylgycerolhomoserine-N-methlytransferase